MTIDERSKRLFRLVFDVASNQLHVIGRHVASNMDAEANRLQHFGELLRCDPLDNGIREAGGRRHLKRIASAPI
jgi:hypothetical protein